MEIRYNEYQTKGEESITGYNNRVFTAYDLVAQGNYNRIEAKGPCRIEIMGQGNTVYGRGDITLRGKYNVASSVVGGILRFEDETNELLLTKPIDEKNAGIPFAIVDGSIQEIVRHNKVPYAIKNKIEISILGHKAYQCKIKHPKDNIWRRAIIDDEGSMWLAKHIPIAKVKAETSYKYGLRGEALKEAIIRKVKEAQTVTLGEYIVMTGACGDGVSDFLNRLVQQI